MANRPQTAAPPLMGTAEWTMLIVLSVLWGGTFFFVAVAVPEVPPLTLVLLRVALAAGALLIYMRAIGAHLPRGRKAWLVLAVIGIGNNVVPFMGQSTICPSWYCSRMSVLLSPVKSPVPRTVQPASGEL